MNSFLNGTRNTKFIKELLSSKENIFCAVAFWGSDSIKLLNASISQNPKIKIKIICNLESGATNPAFVAYCLKSKKNISIRTSSKLHAKVILEKGRYIVGSTNISANGLGHEDEELAGWMEASIKGHDDKIGSELIDWLKMQWKQSVPITKLLLKEATLIWAARKKRGTSLLQPKNLKEKSLLQMFINNPEYFLDKNVYFAIFRSTIKGAGLKIIKEYEKETELDNLFPYENWEDLPKDSYLIEILYEKKDKVKFTGFSYLSRHPYRVDFTDENGEPNNIIFGVGVKEIHKLILLSTDKALIKRSTAGLFKIGTGDNQGRIVKFDQKTLKTFKDYL